MAKPAPKLHTRTAIPGIKPDDRSPEKREHRDFPRADIRTRVSVSLEGGEGGKEFSATLHSSNLSVSGVFLESTFFLTLGQELLVEFELPSEHATVKARGVVVREERSEDKRGARSGFALRFLEFYDQTEVALAKVFLGERLKEFAEGYMKSRRAKSLGSELDRLTDALAAWELLKITAGQDVWGD